MSRTSWRNLCLLFAAICAYQLWHRCESPSAEPQAATDCRSGSTGARAIRSAAPGDETDRIDRSGKPGQLDRASGDSEASVPSSGELTVAGFTIPSWAIWLAPHPGEDLRSYRDRMLPLAQAALAPQRARVAKSRDTFAQLANLDAHQRAELDGAAQEAAAQIQDRVMSAVLGGELLPMTFKPMAGVTVARDVLEIVARGNRRFLDALRDDQRARLAQHPFDFGDYLVFSTRWEDALKFLD
jgi:hypothetical protein